MPAVAMLVRSGRILLLTIALVVPSVASVARTPPWLKALVNVPTPAHDDKADAVLLQAETVLTVKPNGEIVKVERRAFRILRNDGRERGVVRADFDAQSRVTNQQGWSIPPDGKDFEVGPAQAVESAVIGVNDGQLISDTRTRLLRIPGAEPGSVIGYEVEQKMRPYDLAFEWDFQETVPGVEARYTLQLPPGWSYRATWSNYEPVAAVAVGPGQWRWSVRDLKGIRIETDMPPWRAVGGRMFLALVRPDGKTNGFETWRDVGIWFTDLTRGRREPSPAIRTKVAELAGSTLTPLAKMQALARFTQDDIRYVAIELGIGGYQPHPASEVFSTRYGDCKDKVTLLSSMLAEVGIPSHYVIIHTQRGYVTESTPPNLGFNHAVVAIQLPKDLHDPLLQSVLDHPTLGQLLIFDPTDPYTPLGRISGSLQSNAALLVTPDGGELIAVPRLPPAASAITRTAKLTLDERGVLQGAVEESRSGDLAAAQRAMLRSSTQESDRIRPVETILAASFPSFHILRAAVGNLRSQEKPFEWRYSIEVPDYAKVAGDLLLVRPRVLGSKSSGLLETKEPRVHAIVFSEARRDTDVFEIEMPAGFVPETLPPAVEQDFGFAAYRSKTEVKGRLLRYTRSFEIRDLIVPVEKADSLRQFYRTISNDERMVAVLKRAGT